MSKRLKLLVKKGVASALVFSIIASTVTSISFSKKAEALENNQGRVPIMGWSSWNNYRININEDIIKSQADAMVETGLADLGYQYINIDDGYFKERTSDGKLLENLDKFPSGMKSLADYIHSKGLKAGLYSDAGSNTCGSIWDADPYGYGVGMYGHDKEDAELFFNEWGYDFIKVDWCGGQQQNLDLETRYTEIRDAILATGEDVVYNICSWSFPGEWALDVGNSWRISGDINNTFSSILSIIDKNEGLAKYAGPGHFNDMDMLQVGRGMTYDEDKSHFSMWSMMASPLLLGNDLTTMSDETLEIVSNKEMIDINQDVAGLQATKVKKTGDKEVWVKPLGSKNGNEKAVAFFNRGSTAADITASLQDIGLTSIETVRDVWDHVDIEPFEDSYTVNVPAHGIVVLRVSGEPGSIIETTEIEAEASGNTIISPGKIVNNNAFSGGKSVGWLGKGGALQFNNINSDVKTTAKLKIYFMAGEARNVMMSVNGGTPITLSELKSADWSSVSSTTVDIDLNEGNNTIKFYHDTEYAPDIDKIVIEVNKNNYDEIDKVILNAQSKLGSAVVGDKIGQYPQSAVDTLTVALNSAKAIRENTSSTQVDINGSVKALNNAIEDFISSVITEEKTEENAEMKINAPETVNLGEDFDIKVSADKLIEDSIYAMEFNFEYDNSKVDFIETTSADDSKYIITSKDFGDYVKVIIAGKGVAIANLEDLLKLKFNAKAIGNDIEFNIINGNASDENGNEYEVANASINLSISEVQAPEVNKDELRAVVEQAEAINLDDYTDESTTALIILIKNAKALLNDENASQENVDKLKENILDAIENLIPKEDNIEEIDKTALKITIDYSEELKSNGALENVVPAVVNEFEAALEEAKLILAKEDATQEEVDTVMKRLVKVIHMLDFKKGDKTKLIKLVEIINALDKDKYKPSTWTALENELNESNKVIVDENAMEEEVAKTYEKLVKAYLDLRLIPDKEKLEELINKANKIDQSKYTEDSVYNFKIALEKAIEVLKNNEVNESEVEIATNNLEASINNLVAKGDEPKKEDSDDDKPNNEENNKEENITGENNNDSLPRTGDNIASVQRIIFALLLVGGGLIIRRKKANL